MPYGGARRAHRATGPGASGGSHTMVVGPGYAGPGRRPARTAGSGRGGDAALPADDVGAYRSGPGAGDEEPFLQRWLFSRRLVYLLAPPCSRGRAVRRRLVADLRAVRARPAVAKMTPTAADAGAAAAGFQVRTGPR